MTLRSGHIKGYDVIIAGDVVNIVNDKGYVVRGHRVPNYGTSMSDLAARRGFAIGWAAMPDGMEIIFLYDKGDDNFGYAINLEDQGLSEWGYTPF